MRRAAAAARNTAAAWRGHCTGDGASSAAGGPPVPRGLSFLLGVLLRFARCHTAMVIVNSSFMVLSPINDVVLSALYGRLVDDVQRQQQQQQQQQPSSSSLPAPSPHALHRSLLLVVVVQAAVQVGYLLLDLHNAVFIPTLQAFVRAETLQAVMAKYEAGHEEPEVGRLLAPIIQAPAIFFSWFWRAKDYLAPYCLMFASMTLYFARYDAALGASVAGAVCATVALFACSPRLTRRASCAVNALFNELHEELDDLLRNLVAVYSGGTQAAELRRLASKEAAYRGAYLHTMTRVVLVKCLSLPLLAAFLALFIYRCAALLAAGKLSVADFLAMFLMLRAASVNLTWVIDIVRELAFDYGLLLEVERLVDVATDAHNEPRRAPPGERDQARKAAGGPECIVADDDDDDDGDVTGWPASWGSGSSSMALKKQSNDPCGPAAAAGAATVAAAAAADEEQPLLVVLKATTPPVASPSRMLPLRPAPPHPDGIGLVDVTYSYDRSVRPVLSRFSAHFRPGERIAVVGHVGCGKSTVLKLLFKLLAPDSSSSGSSRRAVCTSSGPQGDLYYRGRWFADLSPAELRAQVAFVPQMPVLFNRPLLENAAYGGGGGGGSSSEYEERAARLMAAHGIDREFANLTGGLAARAGKNGGSVSGGERQLLWLVRTVLRRPRVLLLDEPTSSMDAGTKAIFHRLITSAAAEDPDLVVIMVTHDEYLEGLATRLLHMGSGAKGLRPRPT